MIDVEEQLPHEFNAINDWPENISHVQVAFIVLLPLWTIVMIFLWLRVVWHPVVESTAESSSVKSDETKILSLDSSETSRGYGTIQTVSVIEHDNLENCIIEKIEEQSRLNPGDVAGNYNTCWMKSFDMTFLVGMCFLCITLFVVTCAVERKLIYNSKFWLYQVAKTFAMMGFSTIGGLLCRHFCEVDDKGYIITSKQSIFKVNYTRKFQHFMAYLVPFILPSGLNDQKNSIIVLAWGDFFTMLGFLVMIKPLRERMLFFMLQFNSLDRPEDRPKTLEWIVVGNILPGFIILLLLKWLIPTDKISLTYRTVVLVTGIGDGLAEPVGVHFGNHKYFTRAFFSKSRSYTRSLEGSACVFFFGMIIPALQYAQFDSFEQVVVAMVLIPPMVTIAEATAPHSCDTPALMLCCGLVLIFILSFVRG